MYAAAYSWAKEAAYRQRIGTKAEQKANPMLYKKEWTTNFEKPLDLEPHSNMIGLFRDEVKQELENFTLKDFNERYTKRQTAQNKNIIEEGVTKKDKVSVKLIWRSDGVDKDGDQRRLCSPSDENFCQGVPSRKNDSSSESIHA